MEQSSRQEAAVNQIWTQMTPVLIQNPRKKQRHMFNSSLGGTSLRLHPEPV